MELESRHLHYLCYKQVSGSIGTLQKGKKEGRDGERKEGRKRKENRKLVFPYIQTFFRYVTPSSSIICYYIIGYV